MIFDGLKSVGAEQKLFICVHVLPELVRGILIIFPQAHVQHCLVHMVRGSLEYIPNKHCKDCYNAPRNCCTKMRGKKVYPIGETVPNFV